MKPTPAIKKYFMPDLPAGEALKELKALTDDDKAELAAAIAEEHPEWGVEV